METGKVRVEFPLGEVQGLGPLIALGGVGRIYIDPRGLTGKEKWNTQGLEGKCFVMVEKAMADVLVGKMTRLRSRIV